MTQPRTKNPEVTVVIPTRNRLPRLRQAVASVVAQDTPKWEVVVVDDASTDGSAGWAGSVGDSRVRAITLDRHSERSAARNRGLTETDAPAVLFLDDDDCLRPSALRRLVGELDRSPRSVAAIGAKVVFDNSGQRKRIPHPRLPLTSSVWDEVLAGWMFVSGQVLLRTDAVRVAGGWNEDLAVAEDQDLWLRVLGRHPVRLVPDVVLDQYSRGSGAEDVDEVELTVRQRVLAPLPEEERRRAGRLIEARRHLRRAGRAFDTEDFGEATAALLRAVRAAPSLLLSPIWGPQLALTTVKGTAGAALPGPTGRWARHAVKRVRTGLGRNPVEPGIRPVGRPDL